MHHEGHARHGTQEFLHYLSIAQGSLAELETHIDIAQRLDYMKANQANELLEKTAEIGRMLNGLRKSLEKKLFPNP